MRADVSAGLSRTRKELSPRYFYDLEGSRLFEEITALPEYYPTRTERALLETWMPEWIGRIKPRTLIELGAGSAVKSRIILEAMQAVSGEVTYVPVDVSADFLKESAADLEREHPGLQVRPVVADISRPFELPAGIPGPRLVAFLGSTIGNFPREDSVDLLRRVADGLRSGDRFLLGVDLIKDKRILEQAYNDTQGITAAFNLNILRVLNRRLGADFDPGSFRHLAFYNEEDRQVEMHLISTRQQVVTIPGTGRFTIAEGETIRTEISRKYDRERAEALFRAAGLSVEIWQPDPDEHFAIVLGGARVAGTRAVRARDLLRQDVRERLFALDGEPVGPGRLGVEAEFLVLDANTGAVPPMDRGRKSLLEFFRGHGRRAGWTETTSSKGTPLFRISGDGILSFEPGGQIEISTPAGADVSAVLDWLRGVLAPLTMAATEAGLELLGRGIDPVNPVERVPLQFDAPRYTRMAAYFARIGPEGARMMRQTASLHVNVDFGPSPLRTWRFLNAAAPYLTAIFANSSTYAGSATGHQSYRALVWRELDPARTGQFLCLDPVEEYLDFALEAPAFLLGREGDPTEPFRIWWNRMGATLADWHEHLSTLFPDVRPRGYAEVRCIDALPLEWVGVPAVLLTGLLRNPDSFNAAEDLLGAPDPELAWLAGEVGLKAPRLGAVAMELFGIGLAGLAELPAGVVNERDREIAGMFFEEFTGERLSPADRTELPMLG